MTAPSKNFTAIADSAIDQDSPLTEELLTQIRDNIEHVEQWLGDAYTAAKDHNHDGTNSALIEVGPNYLRNGSFESGLSVGWAFTDYSGGSHSLNTTQEMDGANCLAITSTLLANGGGDALSSSFIPVTGGSGYLCKTALKASGTGISSKIEIVWYDDAQAQISTTTAYSSADTLSSAYVVGKNVAAPIAARFAKVKLTGGVPSSGTNAGTLYFDGVVFAESTVLIMAGTMQFAASSSESTHNTTDYTKRKDIQVPCAGLIYVTWEQKATSPETSYAKIYLNGVAAGIEHSTASTTYVPQAEYIPVSAGDLVQLYVKTSGSNNAFVQTFALSGDRPLAITVNL